MANGGWAQLPRYLGEAAQDDARERLLQAMRQGDARRQRAALVLGVSYAQRFARSAMELQAAADVLAQTQQALLALAQGSRDPAVASWAVASCRDDVSCKTKANAVWRQVKLESATPWMVELDLATEHPGEALKGIAQSAKYAIYPGAVTGAALALMPGNLLPYMQQRLLLDVMRMEDQQTRRHSVKVPKGQLYGLCVSTADSSGQAVSSQLTPQGDDCAAIARLFVDRSDALDSHALGLTVGRAAGLPLTEIDDRFEQARQLRTAGMAVMGGEPYACAAVENTQALVRDTASRGEMLALRALAAETAQQAVTLVKP